VCAVVISRWCALVWVVRYKIYASLHRGRQVAGRVWPGLSRFVQRACRCAIWLPAGSRRGVVLKGLC